MLPSLDEVIVYHAFVAPVDVTSLQVTPASDDVQMFPDSATAASLVPSLELAMPRHFFADPTVVSSVHVAPESVDLQIFP